MTGERDAPERAPSTAPADVSDGTSARFARAGRPRRIGASALVFTAAVAFALFAPWRCPIAWGLGIPCPSCGLLRATRFVVAGQWQRAFAMHPLSWFVVPLVAAIFVVELVGFARDGRWGAFRRLPYADGVLVATAASMMLVWLARFAGAFGGPVAV